MEDNGYGLFEIDETSLTLFKKSLSKLDNNLGRRMIYETVFMQVRDAKMAPNAFLELVRTHIHLETSQDVITEQISRNLPLIIGNYVPKEHSLKEATQMFEYLLNTMLPAFDDVAVKQLIVTALLQFARSEDQKLLVKKWLEDKTMDFTPEQTYSALISVFQSTQISLEDKRALEAVVLKDDTSDLAGYCRLSLESALPDAAAKAKQWDSVIDKDCKYSRYEITAVCKALFPKNQTDLAAPYIEKFFQEMPKVFKEKTLQTSEMVFIFLSPSRFANKDVLALYKKTLAEFRESPLFSKTLEQKLREDIERVELYIDGQELYEVTDDAKI